MHPWVRFTAFASGMIVGRMDALGPIGKRARILRMAIPYGRRRFFKTLLATMLIIAPFALFLFPVTVVKDLSIGSPGPGVISCPKGTEFISFRPLWQLDGLPPDATGLIIQSLIVLSLSVGVWAMYPAYKPQKP